MTEYQYKMGSNAFLRSIEDHFQDVLKYEDYNLRKKARELIPIDDLQLKAIHRMRNLQMKIKSGETDQPEMFLENAVLLELMSWFKNVFFKWMDKPKCFSCQSETQFLRNNTEIRSGSTLRVEIFKCTKCFTETSFTRYQNPEVLLKTRVGRCGEWANCFALLCRVLNYETRYVLDTTDHVWVEVYSFPEKRWVHCDPCENIYDSPLIYESGWGKKIEYVIAFSKDDIQDVTWRYTSHHREVLKRRHMCQEADLVNLMMALKHSRCKNMSIPRQKFLQKRTLMELCELMIERKPEDKDKIGRISGSLSWRMQRKEVNPWSPHTWDYSKHQEISIRYSCVKDNYEVLLPESKTVVESKAEWTEGTYSVENMFRMQEEDWDMVYLAREEDKKVGKITWKFSADLERFIDSATIITSSTCFSSGCVKWMVCYGQQSVNLTKEQEKKFIMKNIENLREFTLSAELSGGTGTTFWQHAQIFRQSRKDNDYPFEITIKYK